ncbi:MAG: hypothetical protein M1833_005625 [Piccolia ochrophora]|nr:MAG: hypothetical protein M1833_005625 [Piccolia ochrophora]
MAAVQLSFSLRTSSNAKTVHLLGSWDGYNGQLPLSKDSSKKGGWKGTFRFNGSMVEQGQRYWYYYIIDGYHVSHDPAQSSTMEPTTGRTLNILDVPATKSSHTSSSSHRRGRHSIEIPKGRPLSQSQIKSPKPERPHQTRHLYDGPTIEELATRFESTTIDEHYMSASPSSVGSSLSSRSRGSASGSGSGYSSPSSASSLSDYSSPASLVCTCERYGITRKGDRVKLDCGGSRCGYSDSDCSSESDGEHSRSPQYSTRRQGIVVRR